MNTKPMLKKLILLSVLSLGLAASPGVMAKPEQERGFERNARHDDRRDDRHDRRDDRHDRRDDRQDSRRDHREDHRDARHDAQRHDRHHSGHDHRRDGHGYRVAPYHPPRGYVRHQWHRGDRVPDAYRSHRHVVHDYHSYQLYSPPRGHHWVRVDQDIVLTAVATGVVAAVVYGIFQ